MHRERLGVPWMLDPACPVWSPAFPELRPGRRRDRDVDPVERGGRYCLWQVHLRGVSSDPSYPAWWWRRVALRAHRLAWWPWALHRVWLLPERRSMKSRAAGRRDVQLARRPWLPRVRAVRISASWEAPRGLALPVAYGCERARSPASMRLLPSRERCEAARLCAPRVAAQQPHAPR